MLDARALHVDGVDEPAAIRAAQLASELGLLVTMRSRSGNRPHAGTGRTRHAARCLPNTSPSAHGRTRSGARLAQAAKTAPRRPMRHARHVGIDGARRRPPDPCSRLQRARGGYHRRRRRLPRRLRLWRAGWLADAGCPPLRQRRSGDKLHAPRRDELRTKAGGSRADAGRGVRRRT